MTGNEVWSFSKLLMSVKWRNSLIFRACIYIEFGVCFWNLWEYQCTSLKHGKLSCKAEIIIKNNTFKWNQESRVTDLSIQKSWLREKAVSEVYVMVVVEKMKPYGTHYVIFSFQESLYLPLLEIWYNFELPLFAFRNRIGFCFSRWLYANMGT